MAMARLVQRYRGLDYEEARKLDCWYVSTWLLAVYIQLILNVLQRSHHEHHPLQTHPNQLHLPPLLMSPRVARLQMHQPQPAQSLPSHPQMGVQQLRQGSPALDPRLDPHRARDNQAPREPLQMHQRPQMWTLAYHPEEFKW